MSEMYIESSPRLQAVYEQKSSEYCVVVTHPHSLMSGDMRNNVVMAAWHSALENGYSAVRFNFRGVGRSGGSFDDGNGEVDDLASVISFVEGSPIIIGYSFGAWVAARYMQHFDTPAIFISPPTSMFTFPSLREHTVWAITGELDPFCDTHLLGNLMDKDRISRIPGVDHFWFGHESRLKTYLTEKLTGIRSSPSDP